MIAADAEGRINTREQPYARAPVKPPFGLHKFT